MCARTLNQEVVCGRRVWFDDFETYMKVIWMARRAHGGLEVPTVQAFCPYAKENVLSPKFLTICTHPQSYRVYIHM